MITHGLLGKGAHLVGTGITRRSRVYDPSKSKVNIAGMNIDGIVEFSVSATQHTKAINGVSREYYAYHSTFDNLTLTITVLPTASCVDALKSLAKAQEQYKGWVYISIWENGNFLGRYKGHVISQDMVSASREAQDKTITFGLFESPIPIETDSLSQPMREFLRREENQLN